MKTVVRAIDAIRIYESMVQKEDNIRYQDIIAIKIHGLKMIVANTIYPDNAVVVFNEEDMKWIGKFSVKLEKPDDEYVTYTSEMVRILESLDRPDG